MKRNARYLTLASIAVLGTLQTGLAQDPLEALEEIAIIEQKVMVPMRDGVRLATDIIRPKSEAPVPTIFVRTPYNFNLYRDGEPQTGRLGAALEAAHRHPFDRAQHSRGPQDGEGDRGGWRHPGHRRR